MARDGKVDVWIGIWLSTFALLPLGIFFTRKAVDDSAVFNIDAYKNLLNRLRGRRPKRSLAVKELIINDVENERATEMLASFLGEIQSVKARLAAKPALLRPFCLNAARHLREPLNNLVEYLSNSPDIFVINLLNKYPFVPTPRDLASMEDTTSRLADIYNSHNTETQDTTWTTE